MKEVIACDVSHVQMFKLKAIQTILSVSTLTRQGRQGVPGTAAEAGVLINNYLIYRSL